MFYLIETKYVGPGYVGCLDAHRIEVSTAPVTGRFSEKPIINGFRAAHKGWLVEAHGEYSTMESAMSAMMDKFGEVRDSHPSGERFKSADENVVLVCKLGKYESMCLDVGRERLQLNIEQDITADTTNEQLTRLEVAYESKANSEGFTLGGLCMLALTLKQCRYERVQAENEAQKMLGRGAFLSPYIRAKYPQFEITQNNIV